MASDRFCFRARYGGLLRLNRRLRFRIDEDIEYLESVDAAQELVGLNHIEIKIHVALITARFVLKPAVPKLEYRRFFSTGHFLPQKTLAVRDGVSLPEAAYQKQGSTDESLLTDRPQQLQSG